MIVARHVTGTVTKLRNYVRFLLLIIYVLVPWITWNGRPAILLDIANRKFYFPGIVIWPQEFYYLHLVLLTLGLMMFLFTALFGRLWCGWACPQTVYVELFDMIGRLILPSKFGKRSEKMWHKVLVHSIWLITSAVLFFHFVAYFVGARNMLHQMSELGFGIFAKNTWPYIWAIGSLLFYFDLGLFREQLCVYLCPYARFQSVMLDRDSVIVGYDKTRGEPRRQSGKENLEGASSAEGDCTACNMCVLTCPTGIDIRDGLQVACINCAHCIDACHAEMEKYSKKTLVGYSSLNFFENRKSTRFFRPRTLIYITLLTIVVSAFTYLLTIRIPIQLTIFPDRDTLPYRLEDGVQSNFKYIAGNLRELPRTLQIESKLVPGGAFTSIEQFPPVETLDMGPSEIKTKRIVIRGKLKDPDAKFGKSQIDFIITDTENKTSKTVKGFIFVPDVTGK